MARKFEMIPADIASKIAFGSGVILKSFSLTDAKGVDPADVLCATDGGVTFSIVPEYTDMAEGIDNCPSNTKELKIVKSYTITLSGTAKTIDADMSERLLGNCVKYTGTGSAGYSSKFTLNYGEFIPASKFTNLWYVCDYGDGGWIVVALKNVLNTSGFSMQSSDGDKASFSFTFTAHYSTATPNSAPVEFYLCPPVVSGTSSTSST